MLRSIFIMLAIVVVSTCNMTNSQSNTLVKLSEDASSLISSALLDKNNNKNSNVVEPKQQTMNERLTSLIRKTLMNTSKEDLIRYMEIFGYVLEYVEYLNGDEEDFYIINPYIVFDEVLRNLANSGKKFSMQDYNHLTNDCLVTGRKEYKKDSPQHPEDIYDRIMLLRENNYLHIEPKMWNPYIYALSIEVDKINGIPDDPAWMTPIPPNLADMSDAQIIQHMVNVVQPQGVDNIIVHIGQLGYLEAHIHAQGEKIPALHQKRFNLLISAFAKIPGVDAQKSVKELNSLLRENYARYRKDDPVSLNIAVDVIKLYNALLLPHEILDKYRYNEQP